MAPSKRTVQFEFLVDADARQIDKFHDALKRMGDGSATSEKTLTSLREELTRFASISDKTENNLQAQISALRGAAGSADLTASEYEKLRREAHALQQEYNLLTTNIVGLDKTYKVATRSAREFSQAQKDAAASAATAAQRSTNLYLNNSGTIKADKKQEFLAGTSGAENLFPAQYAQGSSLDYQQRISDLQRQASAVGMTQDGYRKLRLEISQLETEYNNLTQSAGKAQTSLTQLINAPIGNTFNKLTAQVAGLKNGINDLNFKSTEYIATLTRVKELETVGSLRQNRLNTIAENQAYSGATLTTGYGATANLPSLPNTLAADSLLVSELSARIRNLDKGSELYLQTVKDLDIATKSQAASQGLLNRELNVGTETYNRITRRDAKLIDRNNYFNPQGTGAPQAEFANGRFIAQPAPGTIPVQLQPSESTLLGTPAALEARLRYERDQLRQTVAGTDAFRQQALIIKNLELEYKKLTSSILDVGNGYTTAATKAREFTAEQLAAAKRANNLYLNNSGQQAQDAANQAQFLAGGYAGENIGPVDPRSPQGLQQRIVQLQQEASLLAAGTSEYVKRQREINELQRQYQQLNSSIVGLGNSYSTAATKAREFTAEQLAAAKRANNLYLNNSGQQAQDAANQAQFLAGGYAGENIGPVDPRSPQGLQQRIVQLQQEASLLAAGTSEYVKRQREINELQRQYQQLNSSIVGLGNSYSTAATKAREFTAEQLAAAQRSTNLYLNNSGQRSTDAANRAEFLAGSYAGENSLPLNPNSEGGMQQRIRQLQSQASAVAMNEDEYRKLRLELIALEGQYKKLSLVETDAETAARRRAERSDKLKYVGRTVRNVAAAGYFGGPEGLAGAAIGGIMGGPAGAEIGAGIGLAAQQVRMQAAAITDLVAKLNLAKTSLAQVSTGQADYNQKLQFARQVSTDYTVGLQTTIEGYAKITAAAAANGLTLKETETIYKGLLASGVAFGASQDDLQSIITATTQILSKGKISAEELSGQLGERIPGAVAKFAQATGRPLAQLAKDLQDGKVKIADFVTFARGQLDDYDAAAKLIGSSPEKAGERLNLALTRMAETYGGFFQSVGAEIQDFASKSVNWINSQIEGVKTIVGLLEWARSGLYQYSTNTPAVKAFQSLSSQLSGAQVQRAPDGFTTNPADPYGASTTPFIKGSPSNTAPKSNFFADRLREGDKLFPNFTPTLFNQSKSTPILGDLTATDDKAAGKATKAADAAARKAQTDADNATRLQEKLESEQRRRDELLANNAIRLADQVFQHRMDLLRQEYDLNQQLIDATRAAQEAGMTGVARNMQGTINQILGIYDRLKQGRFNDALDLKLADQQITTERKSAENTARYQEVPQSAVGVRTGGGLAGRYMQGSIGPTSTGPHYHVMRRDGGPFGRKALDGFIEVDGAALSSGYTSRGGEYGALRSYGGHSGRDYAFGKGSSLGLKGGATWVGNKPGTSVGDRAAFMTPDGTIYEIIHGKFAGKATTGAIQARTQPGVAQGINRNIVDTGSTEAATADKKALIEKQKLESELLFKIAETQAQTQIQGTTTAYRDQTQALQDQLQEFRDRNRLQLEGVKPEIIEQQMQLNRITRGYTRESETLTTALSNVERNAKTLQAELGLLGKRTASNAASYDALSANIRDNASLYNLLSNGVKDLTAAYEDNRLAQEALNQAENDKRNIFKFDESAKAGIDGYITSIGTLNEAVTGLTQKGFGGMSTALKELATTGTTDFRSFAVSMLTDMTEVIVQQLVVAQLAQVLRNILSGPTAAVGGGLPGFGMDQIVPGIFSGAGPIKFANGGVMTDHGPLALKTYARGGIANTPQLAMFGEGSMPEAYVPLPDGKRIPVAMQGSGGINVSVNVDASGSSAQGDDRKSQEFGKLLGDQIMAVIVREKRPGGTLYGDS
jgi:lambda family phage tail tape measure protein